MTKVNMATVFSKSADMLHDTAMNMICGETEVEEKLIKNYATIERELRSMSAMDKEDLAYAAKLPYKFAEIATLSKAESREFYKRLRSIIAAARGNPYRDQPLTAFLLDFGVNGPRDGYRYSELQSMFGHETTTQAGYFARCLRLIGAATIDASVKGNAQRGYVMMPNWSESQLLSDLVS